MVNVRVTLAPGEPIAKALKRLKRKVEDSGLAEEMRRGRNYVPPSARRREEAKRAAKREVKRQIQQQGGLPPQQSRAGRKLTRQIRKGRGRQLAARR